MTTRTRTLAASLWLMWATAMASMACSAATHQPETDPRHVVEAWHDALDTGNVSDAWALLHPTARQGLTKEQFAALVSRQRAALLEQAQALLNTVRKDEPTQKAFVSIGDTEAMLVMTDDGWRLVAPIRRSGRRQ